MESHDKLFEWGYVEQDSKNAS